jgi:hypothetical protein
VPEPAATARRRGGKSDSPDAVYVARAVLVADHTATPRADGDREISWSHHGRVRSEAAFAPSPE